MPLGEGEGSSVERFDNDVVGFCRRISELSKDMTESFEAVIYPKGGCGIDYVDMVFVCDPRDGCAINAFALRADGSGAGASAAEIPTLIGSVLAASALRGSYAEIVKGSEKDMARRVRELEAQLSTPGGTGDEEVNVERFMARMVGSAKVIGTGAYPPASRQAHILFLRTLMTAACLAYSGRMSSALADEIRGGPAGYSSPEMVLVSRVRAGNAMVTLFLGLGGDEAGVAAEVREGGAIEVLEDFEAIRTYLGFLRKGFKYSTYCTALYGYPVMGQY